MRSFVYATLVVLMAATIVACKSNPYEGKPPVAPFQKPTPTPSPSPVPTPSPTPEPTPVPTPKPVFSLDAPDVMNFVVGQSGEYIIRGTVPAPGTPQITFKDLPLGPAYNAADNKFTWKPGALDVKTYTIQIRLKSSADPVSVHTKDVVMVVSKAQANPTSIVTNLVDNSNDSLVFELKASDMEQAQFPEWTVEGAGAVYSVSKVTDSAFPRTVLNVRWRPESSDSVLRLTACTLTSCAHREIRMTDKLLLKDPDTGAEIVLGGAR